MNFYILISKNKYTKKLWIKKVFLFSFVFSFLIFSINYIVDPYNITPYNLLNIKYKFARDDRTEKVNYFKQLPKFDNIMIGSSRVYSMNPKTVSKILGGTTYNFGVGTATIEDHLGIIKYLIKLNKIPKNIILGVDFYTFNPDIPANKYFLRNKELNFLSYSNYSENYLGKFFSFDSLRASIKTLNNHYFHKNQRPRFDKNGFAGHYQECQKIQKRAYDLHIKKEISLEKSKIYTNFMYSKIDLKRIKYYEEIKKIAQKYKINIYLFPTPLHPYLLKKLNKNKNTKEALREFINYLSSFQHFTNLYNNPKIYTNLCNFNGATHTTTNAGDLIIQEVLYKK